MLFCVLPLAVTGAERERGERGERRRAAEAPPSNAAPAAATPVPPANGFEAFQIVTERNIFNPNRVGRTRPVPEEKPPRVDEIALVGTMQYEKGRLAFFESPDAALRKTAREGETVGEFTVRSIAADGVELTRGEQTIPLKVSQQLRRPEGGEWKASVLAVDSSSAFNAARAPRPGESAAPPAIPADASEVLKRLMKQREKQLK